MPRLFDLLARLLVGAEIALGCWIVHDVAYVTTYRLYISHRVDEASRSGAAQRFDIEDSRVVPQIDVRDDDRVAFGSALGKPSTLHVDVRPNGRAHYEIRWRNAVADRTIAAADVSAPVALSIPLPADAAVVELVSHGAMTWVDPRLVRDLHIAPKAVALALLVVGSFGLARRKHLLKPPTARIVRFRHVALAAGAIFGIASLETGMRALGDRVPLGIAGERHDLGEVRKDLRWENTRRYGRRLRARVDEVNEWRYGDIVRMGYIPPDVSDGALHRFPFDTDDEGFRNARTRDRVDIAALGDSFTDAMTLDAHDGWTTVLERTTGLTVQNYGTAGFGPQQELRVLTDYVVRHRPRVVVLAYFAGNDLFDAEAFDEFERSDGAVERPVPGWQIKDVVSRADTWFVAEPDVAAMMRNRRAQNAMLKRFCAASGIRFLDTTDALAARVAAGENVYFPDESHLNETGHRIVADTLATFLRRDGAFHDYVRVARPPT